MARFSRIGRFAALDAPDRRLLAEAALRVSFASLKVAMLPFRSVIRSACRASAGPGASPADFPSRAAWAVRAVSKRLPLRAKCIEQGIALQGMLRRRGFDAKLHYGVAGGGEEALRAHVWVSLEGRILIGEEGYHEYRCLLVCP